MTPEQIVVTLWGTVNCRDIHKLDSENKQQSRQLLRLVEFRTKELKEILVYLVHHLRLQACSA